MQWWEEAKNKLFAPRPGVSTKRQIVTVISIPVLLIVLLFAIGRNFKSVSKEAESIAAANSMASGQIAWERPEQYQADTRDPMRFGSKRTTKGSIGDLVVKGILYSDDNPAAVIANRIVHEGEKIFDAVILKINKDSVELEINGKKKVLKVQR